MSDMMASSDYMFVDCTPFEEIDVKSDPGHGQGLIPIKSKANYESQYKRYQDWRKLQMANETNEAIMLAYVTERSKRVNAASLCNEYSIIKSMIKIKENEDIARYHNVQAFLKENLKGYRPKHSYTLTKDQCLTFLREAPDEKYLMMKVVLIMGIYGACIRRELVNMKMGDLKHYPDYILVTIDEIDNYSARTFTITNDTMDNVDVLDLIKQYQSLRPSHAPHERLFIYYSANKCTVTPVGKNTLSRIPSKIAKYLQLDDPDSYTGQCFRRTSAALVANTDPDLGRIRKREWRKLSPVADADDSDDDEDSIDKKRTFYSDSLNKEGTETITVNNTTEAGAGIEYENTGITNLTLPSTSGPITIKNCPQGVINIYYQK